MLGKMGFLCPMNRFPGPTFRHGSFGIWAGKGALMIGPCYWPPITALREFSEPQPGRFGWEIEVNNCSAWGYLVVLLSSWEGTPGD